MTNRRTYLVGGGLLLLALTLTGCLAATSSPIKAVSEPPVVEAAPPIENTEADESPPAVAAASPVENTQADELPPDGNSSDYQEGFTEQGEPFKGNPAAAVVIEEFSSYQCPFCAKYFQETQPQVMENYVRTGQVLYIYRDFPLPSQPQSQPAAEAANCAGQIGGGSAYWAMHDRIFERQREWSGKGNAGAIFEGYAGELGLDVDGFRECLDSGATQAQVQADSVEGNERGVTGTPTFFINGRPLVGAQPFAAFVQAINGAMAGEEPATAEPAAPPVRPTPATIASADAVMALGDPNAPVTIVEFSDYQCPFCAQHVRENLPQLQAEFVDTGRVRYVFKDFPIAGIHPQAPVAHEAARCAGEQGAYWAMHDQLYAGQSEWAGSSDATAIFKRYASELGLDTNGFETCLKSGRWEEAVNADLAEGASLGARGTPTFFIDGYPLVGAAPYETFQYAISLAEQGKLGEAYEASP